MGETAGRDQRGGLLHHWRGSREEGMHGRAVGASGVARRQGEVRPGCAAWRVWHAVCEVVGCGPGRRGACAAWRRLSVCKLAY